MLRTYYFRSSFCSLRSCRKSCRKNEKGKKRCQVERSATDFKLRKYDIYHMNMRSDPAPSAQFLEKGDLTVWNVTDAINSKCSIRTYKIYASFQNIQYFLIK